MNSVIPESITLFFDLDGTLIDSREDLADAVNAVRRHFCLAPLPLSEIISYVGDGASQLLQRSLADHRKVNFEEAVTLFRESYRQHLICKTTLYPGVEFGIKKLAAHGFKLAVLSNKPQAGCDAIIAHFGLTPYFTHIIGGGTFPLKPDPSAVFHILKENHAVPNKCWMVGDHHTDIQVARAAGIKICLAAYGFGDANGIVPDLTCHSFDELVAHFIFSNMKR